MIFLILLIHIILIIWSSLYFLEGVFSKSKKTKNNDNSQPLLVVIPAHNEEKVIEKTLIDIKSKIPNGSSIYVIADNCTDQTEKICYRQRVSVVARNNLEQKGKGYALQWFFETNKTLLDKFLYVAIIDADSLLSDDYFSIALSELQEHQVDVLQTHYTHYLEDGYRPMSHALEISNNVRQQGLFNLIGVSLLKGSGMLFKSHVLKNNGWVTHSIAEDLEYSYELVSKDYYIGFTSKATVYGDMPEVSTESEVQHSRWEGGRIEIVKKWFPKLCKLSFNKLDIKYLILALDLSVPPLVLLLTLIGITFPFSILYNLEYLTYLQMMLTLSTMVFAPRWNVICFPSISDIKRIFKHFVMKIKIFTTFLSKGTPKVFHRTPRS